MPAFELANASGSREMVWKKASSSGFPMARYLSRDERNGSFVLETQYLIHTSPRWSRG